MYDAKLEVAVGLASGIAWLLQPGDDTQVEERGDSWLLKEDGQHTSWIRNKVKVRKQDVGGAKAQQ